MSQGWPARLTTPVLSLADFMSLLLVLSTPVTSSSMPAGAVSCSCFPAVYSTATLLQAELLCFVQPPGLISSTNFCTSNDDCLSFDALGNIINLILSLGAELQCCVPQRGAWYCSWSKLALRLGHAAQEVHLAPNYAFWVDFRAF